MKTIINSIRDKFLHGLGIARKLGANGARFGYSHGESLNCSFESGRLKEAGNRETAGYSISILRDGRLGSVSGNRLEDFETMIQRAADLAAAGSVAHFDAYPEPEEPAKVNCFSERTLKMDRNCFIKAGEKIVSALRREDASLDINAGGGLNQSESLLVTSGGVCHADKRSAWSLFAGIQRTEGTDMLFSHAGRAWCDHNEFFSPEYLIDSVRKDLQRAETKADSPSGEIEVFLPPSSLGWFFSPILGGFNGRSVAKGTSPLRDHLGEDYFAPNLTVVDRPHIDFCPSSSAIDSMGIPTRECSLIEKGKINMFLYDLDTAGLAGTTPTGHSGCSPTNALILPGEVPSEELLAGIEDGLYIKSLLGFGQSNIANGDFSCNVALGYRIRNGKIVGRVKNTMIAGNLFEIFRRNLSLSNDVDPVSQLPSAVIRGIIAAGE